MTLFSLNIHNNDNVSEEYPESPTLPPIQNNINNEDEMNELSNQGLGLNTITNRPRRSVSTPTRSNNNTPAFQINTIFNNNGSLLRKSSFSSSKHGQASDIITSPTFQPSLSTTPEKNNMFRRPSTSNDNTFTINNNNINYRKKKTQNEDTPSSNEQHHHHSHRTVRVITDHVAAALELTRTNPNVRPAPAAGMYWSRCVTFGAKKDAPPLRAHSACMVQDRLFVYGGSDSKRCFNTLNILDMESMTWSKPIVSGRPPPPSRAHSCNYVERKTDNGIKKELYVFGGGDGPYYFNDVHMLDTEKLKWTKVITSGAPPLPRRAHTCNVWRESLIIVGGGDGGHALSDIHKLDLTKDPPHWSTIKTTGSPPPERGYHTTTLVKDKLVVYGGSDGKLCFSDIYLFDLVKCHWTPMDTLDRTIPRLAHSATQVGSYIFFIGGHDSSHYVNDVLLLNLVNMSWEQRKVYGAAPNPRGYHVAVLHDSRLIILGGFDGKTVFDQIYTLELAACAYLTQITKFELDSHTLISNNAITPIITTNIFGTNSIPSTSSTITTTSLSSTD